MKRALILGLPLVLLAGIGIGIHVRSGSVSSRRPCFDFDGPRGPLVQDPAPGDPLDWSPFLGIGCEGLHRSVELRGSEHIEPENYERVLNPQTPEEYRCLACAHLSSHRLLASSATDEAIIVAIPPLERALELKPDFAEAYFTLGEVYVLLGRDAEAENMLRTCIRLRPSWANAYCLLREAFAKAGHYNKAMDSYNVEMETRTRNKLAGDGNGPSCCLLALPLDEAQHDYLDAREMGNLHVANGNLREAIECYKRAVSICPMYEDIHISLGEAYLGLGDKEAARKEYNEIVRICRSATIGTGTQCASSRVRELLRGSE